MTRMPADGNDRVGGIRDAALIGSWDLAGDGRDDSGHDRHAIGVGDLAFGPSSHRGRERLVARLAGTGGHFEVPGVSLGERDDFTLTAWVSIPGWHHVAAVREGSAVALYVDGALVDRRTADAESRSAAVATAPPLVLGGGPRAGFEGELAGVRLFGRALTGDEVASAASRWP
jgi:hypothetical protein